MGLIADSSTKNELVIVLVVAIGLGGAIQGFQRGVNCNLKGISVDKPGNGTVLIENTGSADLTLELRRTSYSNGVYNFVDSNEREVTIGTGEAVNLTLPKSKIMKYKIKSCRANSGLIRYGSVKPYDGGPDVSKTLKRFD